MDFGQALESIKEGGLLKRQPWGSVMAVFQRPEDTIPLQVVVENVRSLPQSVKDFLSKQGTKSPETPVIFTSYLCSVNYNGYIMNGWTPSNADMMADDWEIINQ